MNYEILLTIIVTTFNQKEYVAECLDSILHQHIDFPFEVLVGDDASNDGTQAILKEWQNSHNDEHFHFILREKNLWNERVRNYADLHQRAKGKYVIVIEGDDFWLDPNKLKTQLEFLETHPDYIAVAHRCVVVGADSKPNGEVYPDCAESEYTIHHFCSHIMPGQTATVMYRNYYLDKTLLDTSFIEARVTPGDRKCFFSYCATSKIYCIQKVMSAYRHIVSGGSSYSANHKYNFYQEEEWYNQLLMYCYRLDNDSTKYGEYLYLNAVLIGLKKKEITLSSAFSYIKRIKHKVRAFNMLFKALLNKKVLKREVYC